MKYIPYSYQEYALKFILNSKAAGIFLDCGLGKTVITLTAIAELMHNRFEISKALVIAPLRVAENVWDVEAKKWDHLKHLRVAKVLGSEKKAYPGASFQCRYLCDKSGKHQMVS